jgi:hypothetical protein
LAAKIKGILPKVHSATDLVLTLLFYILDKQLFLRKYLQAQQFDLALDVLFSLEFSFDPNGYKTTKFYYKLKKIELFWLNFF